MATILTPRTTENNPHNRVELVRDLSGCRVKMTYYRRDPGYGFTLGLKAGDQGPFDMDVITEGVLVETVNFLPSRSSLFGILCDNGEVLMNFLCPTDPTEEKRNFNSPSQWDGKKNGTYKIEKI